MENSAKITDPNGVTVTVEAVDGAFRISGAEAEPDSPAQLAASWAEGIVGEAVAELGPAADPVDLLAAIVRHARS